MALLVGDISDPVDGVLGLRTGDSRGVSLLGMNACLTGTDEGDLNG